MSVMFEVYYRSPEDAGREDDFTRTVEAHGGRLDYREVADRPGGPVVLTYGFAERDGAEAAARDLRGRGVHVEGPQDYGA
ncbi:MAG: hypothetical protein K2P78_00205 [Gemmataceae bacterium]|nr:hypothetical protein [Gemmataceae bacterium]